MRGAIVLALVAVLATLTVGPQTAEAALTVTGSWWDPEFPQSPERITLSAEVAPDPDHAITWVGATYCTIPVGSCTFHTMEYTGTGNVWNVTVDMYEGALGAKFLAFAVDNSSARSDSANQTITYGLSIALDASMTPQTAVPGDPITVSGQVLYNGNESVPAEGSDVMIKLDGAVLWTGRTDADGFFAAGFTAPFSLGAHIVNVSASVRRLAQTADFPLSVVPTPQPDFSVTSVVLVTPLAEEGETVTLRAVVTNIGNLEGSGRVTITVDEVTVGTKDITLEVGGSEEVTATWVAAAGSHEVTVLIDAAGDGNPANDASAPLVISSRPVPSGPPFLLIGAILGILGAAIVGALVWRRKKG